MKILFAAPENAWGGFLGLIRAKTPEHRFEAAGGFAVDTLKAFDVHLIGIKRYHPEDAMEKLGMDWVGGALKTLKNCFQDPIFDYNVMATPHIAGSTDVSMRGIVNVVAENIRRLEKSLEPLYLSRSDI